MKISSVAFPFPTLDYTELQPPSDCSGGAIS